MGLTDLTSNPFIDGMKKIYELEPFINPAVIEGKIPFPEPFLRKSRAIWSKNYYIPCFHTSFYEVEPILLRCRVKIFKEKEKFIEMRAQGISFTKISKEINVSKPILIEWNREFEKEIAHRQFLATEELLERYDLMRMARLERFTTLLNSALSELKKRNFELLSSKELLDLIRYLEARVSV